MPCYDPRSNVSYADVEKEEEKVAFLEKRVTKLESMLCALVTEVDNNDVLEKAKTNGKCPDIKEWFHFHLIADVNRLIKNGLPKKYSKHEKKVWDHINPVHQKLEGEGNEKRQ